MSRRARTAAAALAACFAATLLYSAPTATAAKPPSRLLVTASEWSMTLSRGEIAPGPAIIELYNRGEDPHDLRVQQASGGPVRRIAELEPGTTGRLETRLKKGVRYRLWCSLPLHRDLGMEATLKVKRR